MSQRRTLLLGAAAATLLPRVASSQQRRSLKDPLRMGVDHSLMESGLAVALQKAFGRDTGIAVQLVPGAALPLLDTLERGELDAALTNAPEAEARLDKQGLVHDRQAIASGSFVIVGPAPTPKAFDPAGIARMSNVVEALTRLRDAALAAPGAIKFLSAGDGSGTHAAEQALWRAAKIAPAAPWYLTATAGSSLVTQARQLSAYALVERGAWIVHGGAPLAIAVEGDPLMAAPVHVMRSFRVNHPAGKIFVAWIAGAKGLKVAAGVRGYRSPG